ncbi:MAG: cytochrome c peroxidase [Cytophagales bacterium]
MRKRLSLIAVLLFSSILIYFSSFKIRDLQPSELVRTQYLQNLDRTAIAFKNLNKLSYTLQNDEKSIMELRMAMVEARLNFKAMEFLAEKKDHDYVKDYLNGAPLPKLEKKVPVPTKLDPVGLQVLDESIFSDNPYELKQEIIKLSAGLVKDFERFKSAQQNIPIYDREVFEACREELIRIFTLGLTGFDTPGSANAIPETKSALIAMKKALQIYENYFNSIENGSGKGLIDLLEQSINHLKKDQDFENFDRLEFYVEYIRPLDKKIQSLHLKSGVETIREVSKHVQSTNYYATEFFSEDYLNPYYYTRLTESDDSEQLKRLGKILFYDPILSANNERSCGSCHNPKKAFTDGQKKSVAKDFNGNVDRNAPTLINSVFAERYFHDMRAMNLETLLEHVVTNRKEFSLGLIELENKLKQSTEYRNLFDEAFAKSEMKGINSQTITAALTSYIKSQNTFNSEFDKYARGEISQIDASVRNGFNIFMGKAACGTCHFAPVFNGTVPPYYRESESEILGVPAENEPANFKLDPDEGRYRGIAKEKINFYRFSFKTPSVRNVSLTAPYMHNGVYNTLEEVMDFYNNGGGEGLGYEVPNQTLPFDNLGLSEKEQTDIIAFMNSLTDTSEMTSIPTQLPVFEGKPNLNKRKIGGLY